MRIYYDIYVNWKWDIPIPQGSSMHLPLPPSFALSVTALQAVVFSDGTSSGDVRLVNGLRGILE